MNILIGILLVIVVLVVAFILFGQLISDARIRVLERDYSSLKETLTNLENIQIDQCSNVYKKIENLETDVDILQNWVRSRKHRKKKQNIQNEGE